MSIAKLGKQPDFLSGATALVTGASSGLGFEIARELAQRCDRIWIVARRVIDLNRLSQILPCKTKVFSCDLSTDIGRNQLISELRATGEQIDVLVNNAGVGDQCLFEQAEIARLRDIIEVGTIALVTLTHELLPGMIERGFGGVLNVGSGAGSIALPGAATYAGTKFFMRGFTDSLRTELTGTGVVISEVQAGPLMTDFFRKAGTKFSPPLMAKITTAPEVAAKEIVSKFAEGQPIIIPGGRYRFIARLTNATPKLSSKLVGKLMAAEIQDSRPEGSSTYISGTGVSVGGVHAMPRTMTTAIIIALLLGAWLLSGQIDNKPDIRHPTLAEQNEIIKPSVESALTRVRAHKSYAEEYTSHLLLRGRSEQERIVTVKAQTSGVVVSRLVDKGTAVTKGMPLCQLEIEDRNELFTKAGYTRDQARIDYDGSLKFKQSGLMAGSNIAKARVQLAEAEAELKYTELEIERTIMRAPFDGIVEETHAEVGDYLQAGAVCATVIDLNPILLVGNVTEEEVSKLRLGGAANGLFPSGGVVSGTIRFIGRRSDESTRTFRIEVTVPNSSYKILSGQTLDIQIPVENVMAHFISPALISLDDFGNLGLRILSDDNVVVWQGIEIVGENPQGTWITGLPDTVQVITVGQELVVSGEMVDPELTDTTASKGTTNLRAIRDNVAHSERVGNKSP